jgi:hypothetical protein
MGERTKNRLLGRIDKDTVLVADRQLTFWSLIMYALGVFTGLGIMAAIL